jgi:microcompartment protein CcmL/EutN
VSQVNDYSEALALLEIDGMPRAIRAQDAALKRAPVIVLTCAPVSPGKAVVVLAGEVAAVEESLAEARAVVGSRLVDLVFLPGVHPGVIASLRGVRHERTREALAVLELSTLAATVLSADAALKTAQVTLGRMHLASGFGGKGFFTLWGEQAEVEAGVAAALDVAGERVLDHEVIFAPHDELDEAAFLRAWPLDPAFFPGSEEGE